MNSPASSELDVQSYMRALGERARNASRAVARANTGAKNAALLAMAERIDASVPELLIANKQDLEAGEQRGLDAALLDRLMLDESRIASMTEGLRQIAGLADPVGAITDLDYRPSGIQVGHMRVPIGVIGIIYESRPNVTADAAALCLKSGNATVLRGGSEAIHSNQAIAACIAAGLEDAGLPAEAIQVIETTDRAAVGAMITMPEFIDVIIPRGGKGLIERISADARVPVIKHLHGVCHVYVDDGADLEMAAKVAFNAKTQRYGTCNTTETLLLADSVAAECLKRLIPMYQQAGVELRACARSKELAETVGFGDALLAASDADWDTEYLAPILSIRVVEGLDAAMQHIARHSSAHTESIITNDYARGRRFLREVDSASVMINASTRFADGFEYGLGAEIGISTDKLHVRGPVGLEGLTTQKFVVLGDGHIRG